VCTAWLRGKLYGQDIEINGQEIDHVLRNVTGSIPVTRSTVSKMISRILALSKFPPAARSAVLCQASKISLASERFRFFVDFRTHRR
jgi:hypothetical protein